MRLVVLDRDEQTRALFQRVGGSAGCEVLAPEDGDGLRRAARTTAELAVASPRAFATARERRAFIEERAEPDSVLLLLDDDSDLEALGESERRRIAAFASKPVTPAVAAAHLDVLRHRRRARMRKDATLRSIPDLVFRIGRDGRYLGVHPSDSTALFVPSETFLGAHVSEIMPADIAASTERAIERALETGSVESFRYTLPDPQFSEGRFFEARMSASGPDEVIAIIREFTEHRRAAAQLERAQETVKALLNGIPDTIFRIDRDGRLLDYQPKHDFPDPAVSAAHLGQLPEQILEEIDWFPRELAHEIVRLAREALDDGFVRTLDLPIGEGAALRHYETRLVACGGSEVVGISRDISDVKRAEHELRSAADIKQALASRMLEMQEAERSHIARELHDAVGQMLLVHKLDAEWIRAHTASLEIQRAAEALCTRLEDTLDMVRSLARGLRPPSLDDLGLGSALETLTSEISRRAEADIRCAVDGDVSRLSAGAAIALYRIAQEALVNAVRHARCERIQVTLTGTGGRDVELRVEDDGVGISPARARSPMSLGLLGMIERGALVGGHVDVGARAGGGTAVVAVIPQHMENQSS